MSEWTFRKAVLRAAREAGGIVRWSTPISVAVAAAVAVASFAFVRWVTGSAGWGAVGTLVANLALFVILFLVKLVTVPLAMAREAGEERDAAEQARQAAEEALAEAKQARRDPDGIYQHDALVGRAVQPRVDPAAGKAFFERIEEANDFNLAAPFEYREWVLADAEVGIIGDNRIGGVQYRSIHHIVARIADRR